MIRCCPWRAFLAIALLLAVLTCTAEASGQRLQASANAGGGEQTGSVYRCISAIGQPVAAGFSASPYRLSRAGGLWQFVLQPERDANQNGIPDEDDPDNDSDGIEDRDEILGTAFSPATPTDPNHPDSDGDGMSDSHEAAAGTDPLDANAYLHITAVETVPSGVRLEWVARGGKTYEVVAWTNVAGLVSGTILETVTAGGGIGPWQVTTAAVTNSPPQQRLMMLVRPIP